MPKRSIVRTPRLHRIPWKNGGGTTREVAVFPGGAGPDTFRWRLSLADIVKDAAFSNFRGTDRHFLLATPGNLSMVVDGARRTAAYGRTEAFPGEADVSVKLSSGPTSVINLITARADCTGDVSVDRLDGPLIPQPYAVAWALLDGTAWDDSGEQLEPLDFLMCGPGAEGIHFNEALMATLFVLPRDKGGEQA
ncbi:HutD family protein [Arthrobacter humicola]|uniref:HutD family protein n=1 Tax=Arthrobacter humicola TaxID=409291 RepID=A0ABP5L1M5_9MICC